MINRFILSLLEGRVKEEVCLLSPIRNNDVTQGLRLKVHINNLVWNIL